MKILLGSHHFFPSTGGIETVSGLLAREFVAGGHGVRVLTQSIGAGNFPFQVIRRPHALELARQIRWCDVFLQNNISLRTLWPLLFVRRPLFIIHQTWIANPGARIRWQHRLKRFVLRYATSFAISRAVADSLPVASTIIGNPYDDQVFQPFPAEARTRELIFVGRLVSDKGANVLLEALKMLTTRPRLTIVGDGPERPNLISQVHALGLQSQVEFVGSQRGHHLAKLLRQHEILVVPSLWPEPFGIVALEGIACGCVAVGSAGGGLGEAIGSCGITFPNGDAAALAQRLADLLADPVERERLRQGAASHLTRFRPAHIARICLETMEKAIQ